MYVFLEFIPIFFLKILRDGKVSRSFQPQFHLRKWKLTNEWNNTKGTILPLYLDVIYLMGCREDWDGKKRAQATSGHWPNPLRLRIPLCKNDRAGSLCRSSLALIPIDGVFFVCFVIAFYCVTEIVNKSNTIMGT